jgi:hypothetical protein
MSLPTRASTTPPPLPAVSDTRLRGRWLLLARAAWLVIVTYTLALFVGILPTSYMVLQAPCVGTLACNSGISLTAAGVEALRAAGFSMSDYATFTTVLTIAVSLVWVVVGLMIFWRRSDDWVALLGSCALIIYYTGESGTIATLGFRYPVWILPVGLISFLSEVAITLFGVLFPNGRFVPRWMPWVVALHLLQTFLSIFPPPDSPLNSNNWPIVSPILSVGFLGIVIFSQIYRYRRVSNAVQRQQTKWVVFGVSSSLVLLIGVLLAATLLSSDQTTLLGQAFNTAWSLCLLPIPISIGIAMSRSRLWDIDTLINKALVYGSLTGLLGALYAGLIIGLENLAGLFGGTAAQNPVVLVISTLAIAAIFQPARRRLQALIDRRFYRKKYDGEKTLAAFSATLRQEVDLEQIHEQLLAVVNETMQPAHVSLWLRHPERPSA